MGPKLEQKPINTLSWRTKVITGAIFLVILPLTLIYFLNHPTTSKGNPVNPTTCPGGDALHFDGNDDDVKIKDRQNYGNANKSFTISVWIKSTDNTGGTNYSFVSNYPTSKLHDPFFMLGFDANNAWLWVRDNQNTKSKAKVSKSEVLNGKWHFLTGVRNQNKDSLKLYLDGVLKAAVADNTDDLRWRDSVYFMRHFDRYTEGEMDEARIWNEARTQKEIRTNMAKGLNGSESNLVGYWNFNSGSGKQATNLAGSNNGDLKNFSLTGNTSNWVKSGAPVGNSSKFSYSVTSNTNIDFSHSDGDKIDVSLTNGSASGIQLVRVDAAPANTSISNSTNSNTIQTLSQERYWIVHAVDPDNSYQYTLTYHYQGHPGMNNTSKLQLAKRPDANVSSWTQTSATLNTSKNQLVLSGQTGTQYILGTTGSSPLPVELTRFKAKKEAKRTKLTWATASETNNSHFLIQRKHGGKWEKIGRKQGFGTTTEPQAYSFYDPNPEAGNNYYRLKQVDFDGSYEYSDVKSVKLPEKAGLSGVSLYPLPASKVLNVDFNADLAQKMNLIIRNIQGKEVYRKSLRAQNGKNQLTLSIQQLEEGQYTLEIKGPETLEQKRFIKQ